MNKHKPTPIDNILPKRKKALARLKQAGFETLEDCGENPEKLRQVRGVGPSTVQLIKDACFTRNIFWERNLRDIQELRIHFIDKYDLSEDIAHEVAVIFFREDVVPNSM